MQDNFELFELLQLLEDEAKSALDDDVTLEERNEIPELDEIRSEVPRWMRVDDVVAVVADLKNSTQFNTSRNEKTIARFYEAYMQQLVDAVAAFDPAFIDIQGDGLFALFDGDSLYERALSSGITMKTYVEMRLIPALKSKIDNLPETGLKVGLASGSIFVKKVGIRGNTEPIWAGKPVNWAAKCAQQANAGELIVTDSVWSHLESNDYVTHSCTCTTTGEPTSLWTEVEIERLPEDRRSGRLLRSNWCSKHGSEFCSAILDGRRHRDDLQ